MASAEQLSLRLSASGTWKQAEALDEYPNATVSQQIVPAIRQLQLNKAVSVTPIPINNGSTPVTVYVYDMGQNAAGGVRLTVPAGCPAGHVVKAFFGEALYTANGSSPRARVAGPPSQGTSRTVDQTNLLGAKARIEFICATQLNTSSSNFEGIARTVFAVPQP